MTLTSPKDFFENHKNVVWICDSSDWFKFLSLCDDIGFCSSYSYVSTDKLKQVVRTYDGKPHFTKLGDSRPTLLLVNASMQFSEEQVTALSKLLHPKHGEVRYVSG